MSARINIRDAQMKIKLDIKLEIQFARIQQLFQQLSLQLNLFLSIESPQPNSQLNPQLNPQKATSLFSSSIALSIINTIKSKTIKLKEVGFFDLEYKDIRSIVNAGKYIFYKDIYVFVDRLKNITI